MTRAPVRVARGALSGLFFVIYGLFALPFALLLPIPIWPKKLVRAAVRACFRLFVFLARVTHLFRVECAAEDRAALKSLRGAIVVMNHVSLIDAVILMVHLGDSTGIAKAAAKRNPFLGAVVRTVFIPNDSGAEKALEDSTRLLEEGLNLVIFPIFSPGLYGHLILIILRFNLVVQDVFNCNIQLLGCQIKSFIKRGLCDGNPCRHCNLHTQSRYILFNQYRVATIRIS